MNKTEQIIKQLKTSNLVAECPCGEEFKLKDAIIFDGTKEWPAEALEIQKQLKAGLKDRADELKKKKERATKKARVTTTAVNVGKNIEKILPLMKDFKWKLADCRVMGDPIDLLTFNGFSVGAVHSLSFIEVKTGKAPLNGHQKAIRDAVEDKKVSYKVYR